jgi:methylmalonyl-CoA mutase
LFNALYLILFNLTFTSQRYCKVNKDLIVAGFVYEQLVTCLYFYSFGYFYPSKKEQKAMIDLSGLSHKFAKPTTEEWIALIEKELKNGNWDSLNIQLNNRIQVPAGMLEAEGEPVHLLFKSDSKWAITEFFSEAQPEYQQLLSNALLGGLEAPFLIADYKRDELDLNLWEGVFTDFVDAFYVQPRKEWFEEYVALLQNRQNDQSLAIRGGFLPNIDNEQYMKSWISQVDSNSSIPQHFKCYHIAPDLHSIHEDVDRQLAKIICRMVVLAEEGGLAALDKVLVSVPIGDQMMFEIAKLRALRVLMHNVWLYFGGEIDRVSSFSIQAFSDTSTYEELENTNRIRGALQGLTMVWGGTDYINILPGDLHPDSENMIFNRRIARNLNHLYRHESYMDERVDQLAGSYLLESLTRQIVEQAWNIAAETFENSDLRSDFFPFAVKFSTDKFGSF